MIIIEINTRFTAVHNQMQVEVYSKIVRYIRDGVTAKRVHNAADILSMKNCIMCIESFEKHCKFELLFILHQLWTPSRMRFFVKNYNRNRTFVSSIAGVDSVRSLAGDFEDTNLRAGLIKGQTNEASILRLLTNHFGSVRNICHVLEQNWDCISTQKKICMFKTIPSIGDYHATHLVRSFSYVLNTSLDGISWLGLQQMSQGVSFVKEQLGEFCMETPVEFANKLTNDTDEKIEVGDVAIIFCEVNSAKLLQSSDTRCLTKKNSSAIRNHLHTIHNIPERNEQYCYISAKNLLRYMQKLNICAWDPQFSQ